MEYFTETYFSNFPKENAGYLSLILGPMFSGKTQTLMSTLNKFADIGESVLIVVPCLETRADNDGLYTHSSSHNNISKKIDIVRVNTLSELSQETVAKYDVIGVEEAQFLEDLVDGVKTWLSMKKQVYIASLDGDSNREVFGHTIELIPLCDDVVKLKSVCYFCYQNSRDDRGSGGNRKSRVFTDGIFTHKIEKSGTRIEIGEFDKYLPVCRKCYEKNN